MRRLDPAAFDRARSFLLREARALDRALFQLHFEDGSAQDVWQALAEFRNADGGFGHGLEPDLRMPGSSVLATSHALVLLREAATPADHPFVAAACRWLRSAYDVDLGAWRSVPAEAEQWPHAGHWSWALHESGTSWPVDVLPRAEILSNLHHYGEHVDTDWLADLTRRFSDDLGALDEKIGADALVGCDRLARTLSVPADVRARCADRVRELGARMVSRDPAEWGGYVPRPLKLAPEPDAILAAVLADDTAQNLIAQNLDWEIEHQAGDGSWAPYWSWNGAYPDDWTVAEHEWRGALTRETLLSLRAWDRLDPS